MLLNFEEVCFCLVCVVTVTTVVCAFLISPFEREEEEEEEGRKEMLEDAKKSAASAIFTRFMRRCFFFFHGPLFLGLLRRFGARSFCLCRRPCAASAGRSVQGKAKC